MRTLRGAIRAVFSLVALAAAGGALAQGGVCLSGCDDDQLPPWVITPGGGGDGGWSPPDPCGGFSCDGGGNDVPPDEGGWGNPVPTPVSGTVFKVPRQPDAPPAECLSDVETRRERAEYEFTHWDERRQRSGYPPIANGTDIEVTYDDGSTEIWSVGVPIFGQRLTTPPQRMTCTHI